jgi:hypothetical protein
MQELTTTANLVEYGSLGDSGSIATVLERSELEAALSADDFAGLWFELGNEEDEETQRLTLELTPADLEEILRLSSGDEVALALDADAVSGLLADPDVEAHGMRGALAVAVATAAFAAPAGLAATPQVSSQVSSQVSPQVSSQVSTQVSSQVAGLGTSTQVTRQVTPAAARQVRAQVSRTQISKSLVIKGAGLKFLRGGLAQ